MNRNRYSLAIRRELDVLYRLLEVEMMKDHSPSKVYQECTAI